MIARLALYIVAFALFGALVWAVFFEPDPKAPPCYCLTAVEPCECAVDAGVAVVQ